MNSSLMMKKKVTIVVVIVLVIVLIAACVMWRIGGVETESALGDHQKYVYAYVSSIEGNEVTYMEVDESVAKAAEEREKEKEKAEAEADAGSDSTEQSGQMQMPPDMDSTEMPQGAPGGMSDMTGETVTTMIPVGVTVHTTSDTTTTFSRLASGDLLKILVETDTDGNEVIEEIWMLQ